MLKVLPEIASNAEEFNAQTELLPPAYYALLEGVAEPDERGARRGVYQSAEDDMPIIEELKQRLGRLYLEFQGTKLTDSDFEDVTNGLARGLINDLEGKLKYQGEHPEKFPPKGD